MARKDLTFCWESLLFSATQQQQRQQQRQAAMEKLAASPAKMQNVVPSVSAGEEVDVGVVEDEDVVQDAVVELVAVMAVAQQLVRLMILLISDAFSDGGSVDMNLSLV
jgi:hypothetical protein